MPQKIYARDTMSHRSQPRDEHRFILTGERRSPQREVALGGFPDLSKLRKKAPSFHGETVAVR